MQLGARIDLDRAPVVLRQSRLLGFVWACLGAGFLYLGLMFSPPPTSLLCAAPTLLIAALFGWWTLDGLRRVVAPQTLILDAAGLTIRGWRSERRLPWARIGNFTPTQAGVAFDVSPSLLSDDRHPGPLNGYLIFGGRFARTLKEARERWAANAPDLKTPDLSRRTGLILALVMMAVLGLSIWSELAHPFAACRDRPDQYAAALCPAELFAPKETAWT